ncbi:uncharacterized protein CANTADRAFT_3448 [Suhomyces tanzawaensis NRRL Y-17324]|uniref:PH domain-containing protein n=1 Tax=Suhomyces tanzawaensis NRRL Y-17324 TaxID=984487 RepID=A0A1E4SPB6_9ASCO|nr:uncharacterized protein CANTADRAFT_3448 [Suhomyces tanzawaensis NRRL Y-17324]ODV81328.1 hypothetical protein CANTADRAFT_3448 [Suhomyces tanzawaensis NRRL Y-17324]
MSSTFTFTKEAILPATNPKSPFFVNIPGNDAKPVDNLINYFKYWKYFIKSLIHYFKEIAMVKEFEANLNYQLINSILFPGFKDLPVRVMDEINSSNHSQHSPSNSQSTTPTKEHNRNLSTTSLTTVSSHASTSTGGTPNNSDAKRPGLFKTKSNNSTFLKNINSQGPHAPLNHKKNLSLGGANSKPNHANHAQSAHNHYNDVKVPSHFFPDDSLFKNLPPLLLNQHQVAFGNNTKAYKDLNGKLIPRLEMLLRNLSHKIKEIKTTLKNESFSNIELLKEISSTGKVLSSYLNSVERYSTKVPVLKRKLLSEEDRTDDDDDDGVLDDPFLVKLHVDYQIKHQLLNENYMFASYVNLQNISKDLFNYVLKELNVVVDKFGKLLLNQEFYTFLKEKISNSCSNDWEYFISMNPNFLNFYKDSPVQKKKETRTFKDIVIPYADSIHNKCIRFGVLYKKSKLFKNYNKCYYVLTCNYLHEFKIEGDENGSSESKLKEHKSTPPKKSKSSKDKIGGFIGHDDVPTKSYNLNDLSIKIKDEKGFKFQLIKNSNSSKKHTFKCLTLGEFTNWFGDLEQMCKFGSKHTQRFLMVQSKIDLKEMELDKSQQLGHSSQTHSGSTSSATSPIRKSLNNFKLNMEPNHERSLSAIFTPTIKTPLNQSPSEGNPFEETFLSEMPTPQNVQSTLSSPNLTPDAAQVLNTASGLESSDSNTHREQHESYLKMQQEILKQQQDILNLKINQLPESSKVDQTHSMTSLPSAGNLFVLDNGSKERAALLSLSRPASNDSISSFAVTPAQASLSGVQSLLNANRDLLNKKPDQPVYFELAGASHQRSGSSLSEAAEPTYQSPVPRVVVSND